MKIVKNVIAFVIFALINGSLEMTPTMEQQEKARIAGVLLLLFGLFMAFIGRLICRKK